MPMMFFYFLKIIFDISTSKRSKKYKPHSILAKKKFEIWSTAGSTAEPNKLLKNKKQKPQPHLQR
jgi:coenzyme F420-reducing hydrogenase beta subunit